MSAKGAKEIAWLAGLLEGEASFSCADNGTNAVIKIAMNDRDTIERAAAILDYNGAIGQYILKSGSTQYVIQLYGDKAIQWMMTIYCLMSKRRKEKIKSVLTLWKDYQKQYRTVCLRGHDVSGDNAVLLPGGTYGCKECRKINSKKHDEKRRSDPEYKEQRKLETKRYWDKKKDPVHILAEVYNISLEEAQKMFDNSKIQQKGVH